jgi:hypothetical protein
MGTGPVISRGIAAAGLFRARYQYPAVSAVTKAIPVLQSTLSSQITLIAKNTFN